MCKIVIKYYKCMWYAYEFACLVIQIWVIETKGRSPDPRYSWWLIFSYIILLLTMKPFLMCLSPLWTGQCLCPWKCEHCWTWYIQLYSLLITLTNMKEVFCLRCFKILDKWMLRVAKQEVRTFWEQGPAKAFLLYATGENI